jgi:hypothetical protein
MKTTSVSTPRNGSTTDRKLVTDSTIEAPCVEVGAREAFRR